MQDEEKFAEWVTECRRKFTAGTDLYKQLADAGYKVLNLKNE